MSGSSRRKPSSPKAASSKRPDQRSDPKLQPKPLYRTRPPKPAKTELVHATPIAPAPDPGAELWRDAGLIRGVEGLRRLLDSPHTLVRQIAACGLAREESRGVHFREDFPVESEALAGHLVVHPGREPVLERWS